MPGPVASRSNQAGVRHRDLKIGETEAKDIALGQRAEIDTRNGIDPGRVTRIDPASVDGTVTVDFALTAALLPGSRIVK